MKTLTNSRIQSLAVLASFSLLLYSANSLAQLQSDRIGGAFSLFNGQDTSAWIQSGNANWYPITDGVAANQGAGLLIGKFPFSDFQIQFNYWAGKSTQFSIYIHCADPNYISSKTALEVNLASPSFQKYGPGSVVGLLDAASGLSTANKWNTVFISSTANQITVTLNGITMADNVNYFNLENGPFAIRFGGGDLKISNFSATIPGRW